MVPSCLFDGRNDSRWCYVGDVDGDGKQEKWEKRRDGLRQWFPGSQVRELGSLGSWIRRRY